MKRRIKKLMLSRETLCQLDPQSLRRAAGGDDNTQPAITCPCPTNGCPTNFCSGKPDCQD
jgi:hypothetical protein